MPYFVDFCRNRRLRAFYKVHKKHLQPRCSKRQRGGGGGFNGFLNKVKKMQNWYCAASIIAESIDYLL